jgi:hypothetical protein
MKIPRRQNLIEYGFVAAMLLLCGTLTALQYRWTGELADAEAERLRASLQEQARRLTWAFDADLSAETTLIVPTEDELSTLGITGAPEARYQKWLARRSRPIFKRLAVSPLPEDPGQPFLMLEEASGKFIPAEWPEDWEDLRNNLRHPPDRRRWNPTRGAWHTLVIDIPLLKLDGGPEMTMDDLDEGLMDILGIEEERRPPPGRSWTPPFPSIGVAS